MMKKRLLAVIGLVLILSLTFLLVNQETSIASECRIVRIISATSYQSMTLDPKTTFAKKGDCVIWYNHAGQSGVKIVILEGKTCVDVVEKSMDFKLDERSCLVSRSDIPVRGTASMVFDKEGSFDYTAEINGTALKLKGTIVVR